MGDPVQWQAAHLLPTPSGGKPYHLDLAQPWDRTPAQFVATAEALEEELARRAEDAREADDTPRAMLVSVGTTPRVLQERNLDELAELADTAGLRVAGRIVQRVSQINPRLILGKGKVAELEVQALQGRAGMLVFDGELSPAQLHNIADITERKVIDRTQLILDIFAQHAVSRAGKLQVELAQLRYTQPRLVGKNRAMPSRFGTVRTSGEGKILSWEEKPLLDEFINCGFFVFKREFLDYLSEDESCDLEKEPLQKLAAEGKLSMPQACPSTAPAC